MHDNLISMVAVHKLIQIFSFIVGSLSLNPLFHMMKWKWHHVHGVTWSGVTAMIPRARESPLMASGAGCPTCKNVGSPLRDVKPKNPLQKRLIQDALTADIRESKRTKFPSEI